MDINKDLQLINTFTGGMNTDVSDVMLQSDLYREAHNLRIIADGDKNAGELTLIGGIGAEVLKDEEYVTIAATTVLNIGVLVQKNDQNHWRVVAVKKEDDGFNDNIRNKDVAFGPCSTPIGNDFTNKLSILGKYNSDNDIKLYIADGEHPLLVIPLEDVGNFNKNGDINTILSLGAECLDLPTVVQTILGTMPQGIVQYAYQMYNKGGSVSQLSPLTEQILVNNAYNTNISYIDNAEQNTNTGFLVKFNLSSKYKYIKIYRILYTALNELPNVEILVDEKVSSQNYYTLYDRGDYSITAITVEEFNSLSSIPIIPKIIESKDNILFAGNIKYDYSIYNNDILNIDFRAFSSGDTYNTAIGIGKSTTDLRWVPKTSENYVNTNLYFYNTYDITKWLKPTITQSNYDLQQSIEDILIYCVGGVGKNISWQFELEQDGFDIFGGNKLHLSNYTSDESNSVDVRSELKIRIPNVSIDSEGNIVHRKNLHRDEVYRYGIVLYDDCGHRYPVQWIADIRTPDVSVCELTKQQNQQLLYNDVNAVRLYVKFSINDSTINKLANLGIQKVEIVRSLRTYKDSATISLGILAAAVIDENDRYDLYCSSGLITINRIDYYRKDENSICDPVDDNSDHRQAYTSIDCLQFYSPETSYSKNGLSNLITDNTKLLILQLLTDGYKSSRVSPEVDGSLYTVNFHAFTDVKEEIQVDVMTTYCTGVGYSLFLAGARDSGTGIRYKYNWVNEHSKYAWSLYDSHYEDGRNYSTADDSRITSLLYYYNDRSSVGFILHRLNVGYTLHEELLDDEIITQYDISNHVFTNQPQWDELLDEAGNSVVDSHTDSIVDSNYVEYVLPGLTSGNIDKEDDKNMISGLADVCLLLTGNFNQDASLLRLLYGGSSNVGSGYTIPFFKAVCNTPAYQEAYYNIYGELLTLDKLYELNNMPEGITDSYGHICYVTKAGHDTSTGGLYTVLCNLRNNNILPYNGYTKYSRLYSDYASFGCVFNIGDSDEMVVYDGDTFIAPYECTPCRRWKSPLGAAINSTVIYQAIIETEIDLANDFGDKFSNWKTTYPEFTLAEPTSFNGKYILQKPAYLCNMVYSLQPTGYATTSRDFLEELNESCYRICYSEVSEPDNNIDGWTMFKPANYIDVELKYGLITNLRLFNNRLFYWQKNAFGVLAVNERVQITVDNNLPLMLGTGGVLERYDYITTKNGMHENHFSDTQSQGVLYWWDYDNKEICAYTSDGIEKLSKTKGVLTLISKLDKENALTQHPHLTYDNEFNEVLFNLSNKNANDCGSLIYNEYILRFTSLYHVVPIAQLLFSDSLYITEGTSMAKWNNKNSDNSTGFLNRLLPYLKYVVNKSSSVVKTFDNLIIYGNFYGNYNQAERNYYDKHILRDAITGPEYLNHPLYNLYMSYTTPNNQTAITDGGIITIRENNLSLSIPRVGNHIVDENKLKLRWGERLRGKIMQCELSSISNSLDFSLQHIITKFRMSWS